jgi:hypothetical protein
LISLVLGRDRAFAMIENVPGAGAVLVTKERDIAVLASRRGQFFPA